MPANSYDSDADAAYIPLGDAVVTDSEEVAPGIVLDFDSEGRVVGIEVLNASKTLASGSWTRWPLPGQSVQSHAAE